jgi:hypothetical protein
VEQHHETLPAGTVDALFEYALSEGVLSHVAVCVDMTAQQPGDGKAEVLIYRPSVGDARNAGILCSDYVWYNAGLLWQGMLSIQPGYYIGLHYLGIGAGVITISWERLTTNWIHQVGQYQRELTK